MDQASGGFKVEGLGFRGLGFRVNLGPAPTH